MPFGNSGNRWWVGMNVGETGSNQTVFGTPSLSAINPFSPSGYESLPSGNAADDAKFAAAAATNKGSRKPSTISVENIEWYNIQGPFRTQAAANAAIPAIQTANPAPGVLGQTIADNNSNPVGLLGKTLSAFTIGGISGTNLVIRGGKMIIGAILIFIGVAHLSGVASKVPGIAGKAVKAAPLL